MTGPRRGAGRRVLTYGCAAVVFVWVAFPLLWLLKSSLSSEAEMAQPARLLPSEPTLDFYRGLFSDVAAIAGGTGQERLILPSLVNSTIVAVVVLVINLALGAPAGYALARYQFRFRNAILNAMLASRMVPSLALLVPMYLLFRNARLVDSLVAVVIAHVAITLPFTVWILRGHFDGIPPEIEKAARVDGATRLRVFRHVALPLAVPGLVVAGLFAFMLSWNDFALALVLTESVSSLTVQPALAGLVSYQGASYGFLFAGSVLAAVPPALVALVLQRHLSEGLLEGSVK